MSKRISINEADAAHVYEWLVMYWQRGRKPDDARFGGCVQCGSIGKRLEGVIGPNEVRRVRRVVAKHLA